MFAAIRSTRTFAKFKAGAKIAYNWSLQNQTLTAGGLGLGGTLGAATIIFKDLREGRRDIRNENFKNNKEIHRHIDETFSALKEDIKTMQGLILKSAISTMMALDDGDKHHIEKFIKDAMETVECTEEGPSGVYTD